MKVAEILRFSFRACIESEVPATNVPRQQVRAYDKITDPYLTPSEEIAHGRGNLRTSPSAPATGSIAGNRTKRGRIQVRPPGELPLSPGEVSDRISAQMGGQQL